MSFIEKFNKKLETEKLSVPGIFLTGACVGIVGTIARKILESVVLGKRASLQVHNLMAIPVLTILGGCLSIGDIALHAQLEKKYTKSLQNCYTVGVVCAAILSGVFLNKANQRYPFFQARIL